MARDATTGRALLTIGLTAAMALAVGLGLVRRAGAAAEREAAAWREAEEGRVAAMLQERDRLAAEVAAAAVARNGVLTEAVEEQDEAAAEAALGAACGDAGLRGCIVFDADGDLLAQVGDAAMVGVKGQAPIGAPEEGARLEVVLPPSAFPHLRASAIVRPNAEAQKYGGADGRSLVWAGLGVLLAVLAAAAFALDRARRQIRVVALAEAAPTAAALEQKLAGALSAEREAHQKLARASELLAIDDDAFRLLADKVAAASRFALAETSVAALLRHVVTVKTQARLFNLTGLFQAARSCEEFLATRAAASVLVGDELENARTALALIAQELDTAATLRQKLLGDATVRREAEARATLGQKWLGSLLGRVFSTLKAGAIAPDALDRHFDEYQRALASLGKQDLAHYVTRFDRLLAEQASRAGKMLKPVRLTGNARFFPADLMGDLSEILLQALRNALDHGVETPEKRRAAGKDEAGMLTIDCQAMGGLCTLAVRDDGRGVDAETLRTKVVEAGVLTFGEAKHMPEGLLLEALFASGFSTARTVTEATGRGVGLDVVRDAARRLGGDATVTSEPGRGFEVRVHFPYEASRFDARLSIFNLGSELETLAAAARPYALQVDVVADRVVARQALVTCDRQRLGLAVKEMVARAAAAGGKRNVRLGLLDETTLIVATTGVQADDEVMGWLLDGGITPSALPVGDAAARWRGTAEDAVCLTMASAADALPADGLTVAVVGLPAAAAAIFREVAADRFGGLPICVRDIAAVTPDTILVFAQDALNAAPPGTPMDATVVVIAHDAASLPWDALFSWTDDPLVVEGALDAAAAAQALEATLLRRRLVALRRAPAPRSLAS